MLEHIPIPARPVRGKRTPVPYGTKLLPTSHHKQALGKTPACCTQAGRPRAFHLSDQTGHCLHCGDYNPYMDRPLGESTRNA